MAGERPPPENQMSSNLHRVGGEPRRPGLVGPGVAHDSPRTRNVPICGSRRFKHHQNSKKKIKREGKKNNCAIHVCALTARQPICFDGRHERGVDRQWGTTEQR